MDKTGKFKEEKRRELDARIKTSLQNLQNGFTEFRDILEKFGITSKRDSEALSTSSSSSSSSSSSEEAETSTSTIIYLDNGSDASTRDAHCNEFLDCSSETSTTDGMFSASDPDVSSAASMTIDQDRDCLQGTVKFSDNPRKDFEGFLSDSNPNTYKSASYTTEESFDGDVTLGKDQVTSITADETWEIYENHTTIHKSCLEVISIDSIDFSTLSDGYPDIDQQTAVIAENSSRIESDLDNDRGSDKTTNSDPNTLDNIFQTVVKLHPIRKFEIPPYASYNSERQEVNCIEKENKLDDSRTIHTRNVMPLHKINEHRNILERFSNIDSHSVMLFNVRDCFSQNISIMCEDLVNEYINVAAKVNFLLIKQTNDVPFEEYEARMYNLRWLLDAFQYLRTKLIARKDDWDKQFRKIDQNLRNNAQSTTRIHDLYHMGRLRICLTLSGILLKFCFQKQSELEDYEKCFSSKNIYKQFVN